MEEEAFESMAMEFLYPSQEMREREEQRQQDKEEKAMRLPSLLWKAE